MPGAKQEQKQKHHNYRRKYAEGKGENTEYKENKRERARKT